MRVAELEDGKIPKWLKCMVCKERTTFCPEAPKFHRLLVDLIDRGNKHAKGQVKQEEIAAPQNNTKIVELGDEHTKCIICCDKFSSDIDNELEGITRHLPVLSSSRRCDHW